MPTVRLLNPRRSAIKRRISRRGGRRNNAGIGGELLLMNPRRRKGARRRVQRYRRRRSNPRVRYVYVRRRRKRNEPDPEPRRKRRRYGFRRRRNPVAYFGRRYRRRNPLALPGRELIPITLWAIGGGVLTRALPQLVLKDKNTGVFGYGANAIVALAGSWAAGKFISKNAGVGVLVGGSVMIAGRLIAEFFGKRFVEFGMTGLEAGDTDFDLGLYTPGYFPIPTVSEGTLMKTASPVVALPAPKGAAVAGMGASPLFASRFGPA